jgi:hypothetical protein
MQTSYIKWHLDPKERCLFTKIVGPVDKARVLQHMHEARTDEKFENDFNILSDITECEFLMTTEEIREAAAYMSTQWTTDKTLRTGIIVSSALGHGLARTYSAFRDDRDLNTLVFQQDDPNLTQQIFYHFKFADAYELPEFFGLKT